MSYPVGKVLPIEPDVALTWPYVPEEGTIRILRRYLEGCGLSFWATWVSVAPGQAKDPSKGIFTKEALEEIRLAKLFMRGFAKEPRKKPTGINHAVSCWHGPYVHSYHYPEKIYLHSPNQNAWLSFFGEESPTSLLRDDISELRMEGFCSVSYGQHNDRPSHSMKCLEVHGIQELLNLWLDCNITYSPPSQPCLSSPLRGTVTHSEHD